MHMITQSSCRFHFEDHAGRAGHRDSTVLCRGQKVPHVDIEPPLVADNKTHRYLPVIIKYASQQAETSSGSMAE